ncbi:MAG: hypothetical protein LBG93_07620 [Treponema sp.]|jgi:hypothetical protein|nr:hypothetical protein [Treponema sp.]
MKTGGDFLRNLLDALLPNRAAPVLARVIKAYEGPGENKYSCDVRVLTAGTLEETDKEIAEVPVNPIWVGQKGKGLYAIPPEDSVVIVEFIAWNSAFPYIAGVWSDGYYAGEFKKGQFVITDGKGAKFGIDVDDLFMFETKKQSMKKILEKMCDVTAEIETIGAPPRHLGEPNWIMKVLAIKDDVAEFLK